MEFNSIRSSKVDSTGRKKASSHQEYGAYGKRNVTDSDGDVVFLR